VSDHQAVDRHNENEKKTSGNKPNTTLTEDKRIDSFIANTTLRLYTLYYDDDI
jgi:hypothetical protein